MHFSLFLPHPLFIIKGAFSGLSSIILWHIHVWSLILISSNIALASCAQLCVLQMLLWLLCFKYCLSYNSASECLFRNLWKMDFSETGRYSHFSNQYMHVIQGEKIANLLCKHFKNTMCLCYLIAMFFHFQEVYYFFKIIIIIIFPLFKRVFIDFS